MLTRDVVGSLLWGVIPDIQLGRVRSTSFVKAWWARPSAYASNLAGASSILMEIKMSKKSRLTCSLNFWEYSITKTECNCAQSTQNPECLKSFWASCRIWNLTAILFLSCMELKSCLNVGRQCKSHAELVAKTPVRMWLFMPAIKLSILPHASFLCNFVHALSSSKA